VTPALLKVAITIGPLSQVNQAVAGCVCLETRTASDSLTQAKNFDSLFMSRTACQHCKRAFLIVNNTPLTEAAYRLRSDVPRSQ
jgi:hypothetical protein